MTYLEGRRVRTQPVPVVQTGRGDVGVPELVLRSMSASCPSALVAAVARSVEYLCERNAVTSNPVKGVNVRRSRATRARLPPSWTTRRQLLDASCAETIKGKRDRIANRLSRSCRSVHNRRKEEAPIGVGASSDDRRGKNRRTPLGSGFDSTPGAVERKGCLCNCSRPHR